jgi:hypothetical protein
MVAILAMIYPTLVQISTILIIMGGLLMSLDYIFDKTTIANANKSIDERIKKDILFGLDFTNFSALLANGLTLFFAVSSTTYIINYHSYNDNNPNSLFDDIYAVYMGMIVGIYLLFHLARSLPKGFLASLGFILFIFGSALQLWDMFSISIWLERVYRYLLL